MLFAFTILTSFSKWICYVNFYTMVVQSIFTKVKPIRKFVVPTDPNQIVI